MIQHETGKSVITIRDDGVIVHSYIELNVIDEEEAKKVIDFIHEQQGAEAQLLLLNDMRTKVTFTREARAYFRDHSAPDTAMAFLINSKIGEVAVNFFLKFNSPDYELRVFNEYDEALSWLLAKKKAHSKVS